MKNKLLTVLFCICLVLFMLTFSIGLPIYCRFLYYIQIKTLGLEERTGYSYEVIKRAYDDVLNFCTLPWAKFKTGELKYTESGAAHFADCKVLFNLNLGVLLSSAAVLITLIVLHKRGIIRILTIKGHAAYFYSAIAAVGIPVLLAIPIAVDFDWAFKVFHTILFPGKDNWQLSSREDEILKIMPNKFFINCAIVIAVGLIAFSLALIAADLIIKHRKKIKSEDKI